LSINNVTTCYLSNQLTIKLQFIRVCVCHELSSPRPASQGHRARARPQSAVRPWPDHFFRHVQDGYNKSNKFTFTNYTTIHFATSYQPPIRQHFGTRAEKWSDHVVPKCCRRSCWYDVAKWIIVYKKVNLLLSPSCSWQTKWSGWTADYGLWHYVVGPLFKSRLRPCRGS